MNASRTSCTKPPMFRMRPPCTVTTFSSVSHSPSGTSIQRTLPGKNICPAGRHKLSVVAVEGPALIGYSHSIVLWMLMGVTDKRPVWFSGVSTLAELARYGAACDSVAFLDLCVTATSSWPRRQPVRRNHYFSCSFDHLFWRTDLDPKSGSILANARTYPNNWGHTGFPAASIVMTGHTRSLMAKRLRKTTKSCHEALAMDEASPEILKTLGLAERIRKIQK